MNASKGRVALQFYAERDSLAAIYAEKKAAKAPKPKPATMQGRGPVWTEEEKALVRKCYYSSGPVALAAKMGRTPSAVRKCAENEGILIPKSLRASA